VNSILSIFAVHLDLDWEEYVEYDKRYEGPAEVDILMGDPAKADLLD
jgi:GDP-D-mannose dehydratase